MSWYRRRVVPVLVALPALGADAVVVWILFCQVHGLPAVGVVVVRTVVVGVGVAFAAFCIAVTVFIAATPCSCPPGGAVVTHESEVESGQGETQSERGSFDGHQNEYVTGGAGDGSGS